MDKLPKINTREGGVTMALSDQSLATEEKFFEDHVAEWCEREDYEGRWALIKGQELVGVYEEYEEAVREAFERFELEPFMISQILRDPPVVTTTAIILGEMFRSCLDSDAV
ncbi:MAG: hypothetical protein JW759_05350 [Candidatus Coatesbacteria bacterium]|nr:hypothetical protein [Candidatus Coatesbacteria bacterium]